MSESAPSSDRAREVIDAVAGHLPARAQQWVDWGFSRWPGRLLTRTASGFIRIELFDRSMTIAAQFFTSVFPILIMAATFLGPDSDALGKSAGLPKQTQQVLDDALSQSGSAAFGIVGVVIVLASATSLSRALTRAYAAIWLLPRPKLKLAFAWRWVAALMALAMTVVITWTVVNNSGDTVPRGLWPIVLTLVLNTAVGVYVPWILLSGQLRPRLLLPGALVLAVTMLFVRPATTVWVPHALELSANRYGSIGVAFTYLASLYVVAFCWLTAALIGHVVATDEGSFGRWIRGRDSSDYTTGEPDGDQVIRPG